MYLKAIMLRYIILSFLCIWLFTNLKGQAPYNGSITLSFPKPTTTQNKPLIQWQCTKGNLHSFPSSPTYMHSPKEEDKYSINLDLQLGQDTIIIDLFHTEDSTHLYLLISNIAYHFHYNINLPAYKKGFYEINIATLKIPPQLGSSSPILYTTIIRQELPTIENITVRSLSSIKITPNHIPYRYWYRGHELRQEDYFKFPNQAAIVHAFKNGFPKEIEATYQYNYSKNFNSSFMELILYKDFTFSIRQHHTPFDFPTITTYSLGLWSYTHNSKKIILQSPPFWTFGDVPFSTFKIKGKRLLASKESTYFFNNKYVLIRQDE